MPCASPPLTPGRFIRERRHGKQGPTRAATKQFLHVANFHCVLLRTYRCDHRLSLHTAGRGGVAREAGDEPREATSDFCSVRQDNASI